jgi:serine/threonine protein kinase
MEMRSFGQLQEKLARKIFQDISSAIQYCHQKGIAHRDLKLENILIDPTTYRVKLIDFGLCSFEKEDSAGCVDVCGSLDYIAPEVLTEQPYSAKTSDMWSLGVILYSLLFATFPFSTEERMDALLPPEGQDKRPHPEAEFPRTGTVSRDAQDLCAKLLSVDPTCRISIERAMQHPWMTATDVGIANNSKPVRNINSTKRQNKFTRNASDSRVVRSNGGSSSGTRATANSNYYNNGNNSNNINDSNGSSINDLVDRICRDFGNINVRPCPKGCVRDCGSEVSACIHDCSCRQCLPAPV